MKKNYDLITKLRKENSCLFENIGIQCSCNGKLKTEKNHLIAKSSYLKRIALKNKVLIFDFESKRYLTNRGELIERNIKNANVYHVLCGAHDKYLFDEIENGKSFDVNNKKQLFQFALRAFVFSLSENRLKSNKAFDKIASNVANEIADNHLGINNERLKIFQRLLCEQKWDRVETKVIELNQKIPFISCCALTPNYGIVFPVKFTNCMILFNAFPENDKSFILLSYLKDDIETKSASRYCIRLEKMYLNNREKFTAYMNKFFIAFDHKITINPAFWNELSVEEKERFYRIAHIFPKSKTIFQGLKGFVKLKLEKNIVKLIS